MGTKDRTILEKHEDYMEWEKLSQHCETIDGLTEFEKDKAKRAFLLLRKDFGDEFLKSAFVDHHPICQYIVNLAPWTRKWIVWFAEAIKELQDQENYPNLLCRLKDREKFGEGLSVLEIAYKLSKTGFRITFDPPINRSGQIKIPDLKVCNDDNGEELFVEVSIQKVSIREKEAWQTMQRIHEPLWRCVPFMHYCGRIHKILAERHLDDITKKIEKTVERVKKESVFHELVIEGIIEIGIAPEHDKEILQKWATERELKVGEFSGPSYDVDEITRTKIKIGDEQRQLPSDNPNIVVVVNNNLFLHVKDMRQIISELEEEVYKYPHLLSVIMSGGHMGRGENTLLMKDQHVYISKTKASLLVEQCIILFNQFCDHKTSPGTITKMYNAFRSY